MVRLKCIDLNTTTMNIKKVFIGVSFVMTAMAGHSQSVFQVKQQSLPNPDNAPTAAPPAPRVRQMFWQEPESFMA